jgi:hypothetical protein
MRRCAFRTIEEAARVEGLEGDELQGGARHGRLHRQAPRCADGCRVELRGAEVAHLLHKRPAQPEWQDFQHTMICESMSAGAIVALGQHLTNALLPTLAAPMM